MAKLTVKGLEEYAARIERLGRDTETASRRAVYAGAKVVADRIRDNLERVDTITGEQKKDLLDALGVAPLESGDRLGTNTKIGFDGYGGHPTERYPKGLPNQLLARAVESGTSFRPKRPFVRPAVNASRQAALREMERVIDQETTKIMKE